MSAPRFAGQVALVTGAGGGLGAAIGARLAAEGATVFAVDRDRDRLQRAAAGTRDRAIGNDPATGNAATGDAATGNAATGDAATREAAAPPAAFHPLVADVTEEEQVSAAVAAATAATGRLDIVVNCAGIIGPHGTTAAHTDTAAFDHTLAINLRGSFLVAKHALRVMEPAGYGRVLLIASIAGKEGNAGMCAYSASKAGVIGLTKALGKEYAETGVTVNALAPAVIWTDLIEQMEPEQVSYMTERIPMRRCGTLAEVAALACWIVSAEASFNTGAIFDLSGGRATY